MIRAERPLVRSLKRARNSRPSFLRTVQNRDGSVEEGIRRRIPHSRDNRIDFRIVRDSSSSSSANTNASIRREALTRLGDTESAGPSRRVLTLRRLAVVDVARGCSLPGKVAERAPRHRLTLKHAKRSRTRCVNCRKVVQLDGITRGDESWSPRAGNRDPGTVSMRRTGFPRVRRSSSSRSTDECA